jgi:hypothetical protein
LSSALTSERDRHRACATATVYVPTTGGPVDVDVYGGGAKPAGASGGYRLYKVGSGEYRFIARS